jgi:hypothetical protein
MVNLFDAWPPYWRIFSALEIYELVELRSMFSRTPLTILGEDERSARKVSCVAVHPWTGAGLVAAQRMEAAYFGGRNNPAHIEELVRAFEESGMDLVVASRTSLAFAPMRPFRRIPRLRYALLGLSFPRGSREAHAEDALYHAEHGDPVWLNWDASGVLACEAA